MAMCVHENARRATLASTPSRSTQAGARHRERAELTSFFPSPPHLSHHDCHHPCFPSSFPWCRRHLSAPSTAGFSPSSPPLPPFSATALASLLRPPLSSATIAALRPSVSVTKTERRRRPPVSSSSRHRSSHLLFLSTSDYYLDHRRRLPSLFLSPAPPSAYRHHLPLLPLLRARESSHQPLPPSPFPPPSTIELLSPFSLSVAVIPTPSPSSPAPTNADLPLLSLSSLLHLVVGSLLLLPAPTRRRSPPPLLPFLPSGSSTICKLPRTPFSLSGLRPASPPSPFPPASSTVKPSPIFGWFSRVRKEMGCGLVVG